MPTSDPATHGPMVEWLLTLGLKHPRFLDCGVGSGAIGQRIHASFPDAFIVGLEIWVPYIHDEDVKREIDSDLEPYAVIYAGEAQGDFIKFLETAEPDSFNVIIFGDSIEHVPGHVSDQVLKNALRVATTAVVVNTPRGQMPQCGPEYGNPYEAHVGCLPPEHWLTLGATCVGGNNRVACYVWLVGEAA